MENLNTIDNLNNFIDNNINSHFELDDKGLKSIQVARIDYALKTKFMNIISGPKIGEEHKINDLSCVNDKDFDSIYKAWLSETFFKGAQFNSYKTDITKRIQYSDDVVYSNWHREFCNPDKLSTIGLPLRNQITSNTHIVLYYPLIENCKKNCGTRLRFNTKDGGIRDITLPTNENMVYCLRDCCFSHMSPTSEAIDESKPIERVIVRSYITPVGYTWETSKCPLLVADWGSGGMYKKDKKQIANSKSKRKIIKKYKKRKTYKKRKMYKKRKTYKKQKYI